MFSYEEISHCFMKERETTSASVDSYLHFTLQQINHSNKVILSNGAIFDPGMHKIRAIFTCWGYFNKLVANYSFHNSHFSLSPCSPMLVLGSREASPYLFSYMLQNNGEFISSYHFSVNNLGPFCLFSFQYSNLR